MFHFLNVEKSRFMFGFLQLRSSSSIGNKDINIETFVNDFCKQITVKAA